MSVHLHLVILEFYVRTSEVLTHVCVGKGSFSMKRHVTVRTKKREVKHQDVFKVAF